MSTLTDIQHLIAPELRSLNDLIAQTLTSPNEMMNQIITNYLKTKGKQIRPILVILSARLLGEVTPDVISSAAAVELLHNASLIHDDVVDETRIRRGNPTINGVWDNNIAVLIGDFFVSSSLALALRTGNLKVVDAIANLGRTLSIGELDQIYCARFHTVDEDAYFKTIERKTASLFMACVEMGGHAVNADPDRIATLAEFARLLGLCFQIKDDIFDYFEDEAIGKPTGNDLREGKITLPLLHTLLNEAVDGREQMRKLIGKETLGSNEISTLIEFAKANGGIDYAYCKMRELRDRAALLMRTFGARPEADLLMQLLDYTIERRI